MKIKDWPPQERPREKLLSLGPAALSDAELLAIFLRTGLPGVSAVDLARQLLIEFGSLRKMLAASPQRFCQAKGLGTAKYAQLQAVVEMSRRYLAETLDRSISLTSAADCAEYLSAKLRDEASEVFAMLLLDSQHRVIRYREMFRGTINSASVYPRELVKQALEDNAAAIILAHNHPSGVAEPSEADLSITRRITDALALVEIKVLDHFVIGDRKVVSFAQLGLM